MTSEQQIELGPIEAFQDITHRDKKLFRVILRGFKNIQEIKLTLDAQTFEMSAQKQFVNSINRLSHVLWFSGVPQNGMKLAVTFKSDSGNLETTIVKVRSDALQTYFRPTNHLHKVRIRTPIPWKAARCLSRPN
jgi:hypothetical protein